MYSCDVMPRKAPGADAGFVKGRGTASPCYKICVLIIFILQLLNYNNANVADQQVTSVEGDIEQTLLLLLLD